MFQKIFIEKGLAAHPRTKAITKFFPRALQISVGKYTDIFGQVKKPYLQKRSNLNLFIAQKKGKTVKLAPPAYGLNTAQTPHYYFTQAFNCIYECEYCYLQGYFSSPDIVLFINFEDMAYEMETILKQHPKKKVWFHSGEFTDSLALSHLTGEVEFFHQLFKKNSRAYGEFRTKSANIRSLLKLKALENLITTFSMSPQIQIQKYDHKTASLSQRLKAIEALHEKGFPLGLHFDPIIPYETYLEDYKALFKTITERVPLNKFHYISLGVVRYSQKTFLDVKRNYPGSSLLGFEMIKSEDKKIKIIKPLRKKILQSLRKEILKQGVHSEKVYLCME